MQVYTLTELTRNASADRRVVIQGFDLPMRGLAIVGVAAIPALLVAIVGWAFIGEYAIVLFFGVELAAYWLIETRSRRGLQLKRYQTIIDRCRSVDGRFTCCGVEIDPAHGVWATVRSSSVHREGRTVGTADGSAVGSAVGSADSEPGGGSAHRSGELPDHLDVAALYRRPADAVPGTQAASRPGSQPEIADPW